MKKEAFKKVSNKLGIPLEVVEKVYNNYWLFIKTEIQELPLKDNISEEEFAKLKTNFNVPSLGKLSCNYDRLKGVKKRYKYLKEL